MLRTLVFTGLIAAGLAGAASAAEPGQRLVNRTTDAADFYAGRNNLVGGTVVNTDGTVGYIYQGAHGNAVTSGYDEPPAASYQGW